MVSSDSGGSPSKDVKQPAKRKAAGKAKTGAKKADKALAGKAQKVGARQPKAGRKGKQAADEGTTGRAEDEEDGSEYVSEGQKPGRKGKQVATDKQKQKAAAAPKKPDAAKPATRSRHAHNKADEEEKSAASSEMPSSPVSVTKAQPVRRGRKALSNNAAKQDGVGDSDGDEEAATHSPQRKRSEPVKAARKAGRKAAPKEEKAGSKGQRKEAKTRQPSTRQQPR